MGVALQAVVHWDGKRSGDQVPIMPSEFRR